MDISVSEAKGQLTELVRRVEEGEEVILTRHGKAVARIQALKPKPTTDRRAVMESIRRQAPEKAASGIGEPEGHDFLYDEDGLPG